MEADSGEPTCGSGDLERWRENHQASDRAILAKCRQSDGLIDLDRGFSLCNGVL
jgi:hypothetical protein